MRKNKNNRISECGYFIVNILTELTDKRCYTRKFYLTAQPEGTILSANTTLQ